jgi:rhamnogalacturonan endolyase
VLAAWDWDGQELTQRWVFDTNNPKWASYAGQGNHNLRVADVDGDGWDEITYGSMAVDHDGRGLYNTNMGHGDAIHLIADPKDGRLYIWDCHENKRDGSDLRDAKTGRVVFQVKSPTDVGRCMAADIDPRNPGAEMWSIDSRGVRNMKGEVLENINPRGLSINFGIWWDGDLQRELLDRSAISKYDWENDQVVTLQRLDGVFNNGTKQNPCLSADILGDWREEVLVRNSESTELRLYVSTIPTDHRIECLMQDIPYRLSVATENVGYNQPPEMGRALAK